MSRYLVATVKPWNLSAFERYAPRLPGEWQIVTSPKAMGRILELGYQPRYIFFPHWSWKVPAQVLDAAECVCFHSSDVPYGRGGSPIQNLIQRGHEVTKLTALRMVEELDAGPVYTKRDFSLEGSAQEIFERLSVLVYELIEWIVREEPEPKEQEGTATIFRRRTPSESLLPADGDLQRVYDHIRMLDADSYPAAYCEHGVFRLELSKARLVCGSRLVAEVEITRNEDQ